MIEVDGPYHMPAKDEFKERLLRKLGYTVERVSYRDRDGDKLEERINAIVDRYQLNRPHRKERRFLGTRVGRRLAEKKEKSPTKRYHG
ncbi:RAP domain-containing protein [Coxiella burnetii]